MRRPDWLPVEEELSAGMNWGRLAQPWAGYTRPNRLRQVCTNAWGPDIEAEGPSELLARI
jgi:hypothetical protein